MKTLTCFIAKVTLVLLTCLCIPLWIVSKAHEVVSDCILALAEWLDENAEDQ